MNDTNRALNRLVLFVVGVVLVALGAAVVLVMVWPAAADLWRRCTQAGQTWIGGAVADTTIAGSAVSWVAVAVLAVLLLIVVVLIALLVRLGGGRTKTVIASDDQRTGLGRATVTAAFASDALQSSFGKRPDILFSSVTAHEVRKEPVLHVSVSPRKNTSPRRLVDDVDRLLANLAALTGRAVPAVISIHSGLRTRLADDQRRVG